MTLIQRFLELLLTRNASILMVGYGLLNLIAHSQHEIKAKSLSDLKWHLAEVAPISGALQVAFNHRRHFFETRCSVSTDWRSMNQTIVVGNGR
jgi:hypothetical protein